MVTELTTVAFAMVFFALIFKILPDVNAPWKDIFVGAIATTALFMLGKYFIGLYLTASGISTAYRAAGSLVIFIVWASGWVTGTDFDNLEYIRVRREGTGGSAVELFWRVDLR